MLNLGKRPIAGAYYGSQKIGSMYVGSRKIYGGGSRPSVPGFVGGWRAYGRSNSEDASTRDMLPDYSGNGRDIRLYNFAFSGMSGWGGYGTDMSNLVPHDDIAVTETAVTSLKCTSILQQSNSPIAEWGPNRIASGPTTIRFRVTGVSDNLGIRFESYAIGEGLKTLFTATSDGVYTAEISDPTKYYRWIAILPADAVYPLNCNVTIEQLPVYPGGLVSDGVDDYGECVKQFVLTDFTVVALRDYANFTQVANSTFVSKVTGYNANGAFLFEDGPNMDCFSFGSRISNSDSPALFSYLTKTSFNGKDGTPGTTADTDSALLHLFSRGGLDTTPKKQAVLYDLRIYDHSLTAEELQTVKDEMMADYEKATGGGYR